MATSIRLPISSPCRPSPLPRRPSLRAITTVRHPRLVPFADRIARILQFRAFVPRNMQRVSPLLADQVWSEPPPARHSKHARRSLLRAPPLISSRHKTLHRAAEIRHRVVFLPATICRIEAARTSIQTRASVTFILRIDSASSPSNVLYSLASFDSG